MLFLFEESHKPFGKRSDLIDRAHHLACGVHHFAEINLPVLFFELRQKALKL